MKTHNWYRFRAQADHTAVDIYVFREIGEPWFGEDTTVRAEDFIGELNALSATVKKIRVHINSPGGDPFEATVIANALRDQRVSKGRGVEVIIEGMAASAATIISCAGSPIRIAENALMMIHNPFTMVLGNADDLRQQAAALDKMRDSIIATYQWVSNKSETELAAMMAATTWMDADEAIAAGFATEKVAGASADSEPGESMLPAAVAARLRAPARYQDRVAALVERPKPAPIAASAADVMRLCRESDVLNIAEELIVAGLPLPAVQERVSSAAAAKQTATDNARLVRAMCDVARVPQLADGYLALGATPATVGPHLCVVKALIDDVEIDGSLLDPTRSAIRRGSPPVSAAAVYRERNAPQVNP